VLEIKAMLKNLPALFCGILFGAGLVVSQMVNPVKVLAFLDITGHWDPSLALVMAGALITFGLSYRLILRRSAPILEQRFHLPTAQGIDARLLIGGALFGIGWGLSGFCPGAAIAAIGYGRLEALLFTLAMFGGVWLFRLIHSKTKVEQQNKHPI
jgi:uncharacterized membrane protein YedE/YeeE